VAAEQPPREGRLREKLAALAAEEKVLSEELDHVTRRIREAEQASDSWGDLEDLRRDLEEARSVLGRLVRQIHVLQVELEAPARVRLLEEAQAP
jgi:hypothetical protein